MTTFLTDADVRAVFDWRGAIETLRAAYSVPDDAARFPGRTMARGDFGWLRILGGVPAGSGLMGAKLIAASPTDRRAAYLIPLFDQRTAELVALLDGNSVTGFRTAATSALAADVLAPDGPPSSRSAPRSRSSANSIPGLSTARTSSSPTRLPRSATTPAT